jgi:hypothetical protein
MKLLILQFSATSCHFLSLGAYILLSTLFSNTFHLRASLNMKNEVPYPYKTDVKNS